MALHTNPPHTSWIVDTGDRITTACGREVVVCEFQHQNDAAILSAWATHFRNHYCADQLLPDLVDGTGLTNAQYLIQMKFPDISVPPGPSVRSGDFAEILVSDYIQYVLNYWCPRELRYNNKFSRNESSKGCDVIGFWFQSQNGYDLQDRLFIFESKAKLTGDPANQLQVAIDDSIKDAMREAMSLNAIKQRLIEQSRIDEARHVQRFQNYADRPFRRINGAAAVVSNETYNPSLIGLSDASLHQNQADLTLLVIRGEALMTLVHALYERAANEA